MSEISEILTLKEASAWVNSTFKRKTTPSNISYLIQYGQIRKINGDNKVYRQDLFEYFANLGKTETEWKKNLGNDLDWHLSFDKVKESERTKHVHRLHPYKGKFIPQLVEYFLDDHIDEFKKITYFSPGDVILDPFCGSGTALVQANELGLHAFGIDISEFNTLISNVKVGKHNLIDCQKEVTKITTALREYIIQRGWQNFENELLVELANFNKKNFPSPEYVYAVRNGEINQAKYSIEKENEFQPVFNETVKKHHILITQEDDKKSFLGKWYLLPVRQEIDFVVSLVNQIQDPNTRDIIRVILSRTVRSCRATTHADLATLINPVTKPYYCQKHYKICKPLFSIFYWWDFYSRDTIKRISEFQKLHTNTHQLCLTGDSREIDILGELSKQNSELEEIVKKSGVKGIFSSPPYVGMIDYHEQHAYAYELFGLDRRDNQEIGPLFKGKGSEARASYVDGISSVLINCKKYLSRDYNVLLVANDSYNLYPEIAKKSGMRIVNEFKRPVLNRTEKDKSAYAEKIFHLKD